MGAYFNGQKMEIPGRRGGLHEIPSMVEVSIFSGTTDCIPKYGKPNGTKFKKHSWPHVQ